MNSPRKKICIVSPSFKIGGGAEKVAFDIGYELEKKGFDVFYFSFQKSQHEYIKKSCKYFSLNENKSNLSKFLLMPIYSKHLANYCKKNKITYIISHTERGNIISLLSKKMFLRSIKVITATHNIKYFSQKKFKYLIKLLYSSSYRNVCVSKQIELDLKKKFKLKNTQTIYNGFDFIEIEKKMNQEIEKKDLVYFENKKGSFYINVGRLTHQKGQESLIKDFKKIVNQDNSSKLFIFGEGELKTKLQNLINTLNLQNNVFLMGVRKNIFPYYKKCDVFIFSSYWEGFGLVLVEALYSGLKVISRDCKAGPREILAPNLSLDIKISYPYKGDYGELYLKSFDNYSISNLYYNKKTLYYLKKFDKSNTLNEYAKLIQ